MTTIFRKLLIRIGKILPFLFVAIVLFGYAEDYYAIFNENVIYDADGNGVYYAPISEFISVVVFIDWIDVLLLYILSFALEYCSTTRFCVHLLTLNLVVRFALENGNPSEDAASFVCACMVALCAVALFGGVKKLFEK